MPFVKQESREFSNKNVEILNPNQSGIYGIFNTESWIYIGKAEDIRKRLLEHLNGDNPCILKYSNLSWVGEVINDQKKREDREKELILELDPTCNRKIG